MPTLFYTTTFLVYPLLTTSTLYWIITNTSTTDTTWPSCSLLHYLLPFSTYNLGFTHMYSHASILHVILPLIKPFNSIIFSLSITTKSSAYNNSNVKAILNSVDKASMTITNSNGCNAEPWCIPTFTSNSYTYHKLFLQLFLHLCT